MSRVYFRVTFPQIQTSQNQGSQRKEESLFEATGLFSGLIWSQSLNFPRSVNQVQQVVAATADTSLLSSKIIEGYPVIKDNFSQRV